MTIKNEHGFSFIIAGAKSFHMSVGLHDKALRAIIHLKRFRLQSRTSARMIVPK